MTDTWHSVPNKDLTMTLCQCPDKEHHIMHWLCVVTPSPNVENIADQIIADHNAARQRDLAVEALRDVIEGIIAAIQPENASKGGE